jgi:hypothetical protein
MRHSQAYTPKYHKTPIIQRTKNKTPRRYKVKNKGAINTKQTHMNRERKM